MTSPLQIHDHDGGVRLLVLDRPRANAFDRALMEALSAAIHEAAAEPAVRALVLAGAGEIFSAGLDFKALMVAQMAGETAAFGEAMERAFLDLWTYPLPTIAAVHGHAIAAGYLVAIACDVRLVTAGAARYGLNELVWGAGFPTVAIELARSVLGERSATVILGGELFDAAEGQRNGSFHQRLDDRDALLAAAITRARALGERPRAAYAHAKALLQAPFVERARAETPATRARMAAATASEETLAALGRYLGGLRRG